MIEHEPLIFILDKEEHKQALLSYIKRGRGIVNFKLFVETIEVGEKVKVVLRKDIERKTV